MGGREWGNAKAQGRNEKQARDSRLRGNDGEGAGTSSDAGGGDSRLRGNDGRDAGYDGVGDEYDGTEGRE